MDCMQEWSDRVNSENIDRILELGHMLTTLSPEQKPMRMTLCASKLAGDGVARSTEEAYIMLTDACIHAEVWKLMDAYDQTLKDCDVYITKLKHAYKEAMVENAQLKAQLKIQVLPLKKKTTGRILREA
jgi:hypothetical protein